MIVRPSAFARHQEQRRALVGLCLDRDQLGDGCVCNAVLGAVDDPVIAVAGRGGGEAHLGGGAVVVDAERAVVVRLTAGQRQVIIVVLQERRAEALALLRRHRAEQTLAERRRLRQHRGDIGIPDRKLFGDDA